MKWLILLIFLSSAAYAQEAQTQPGQACAPRDGVRNKLREKFGEKPIAEGLNKVGIVELWVGKKTGTFTVIINRTDGMACMIASGNNLNMVNEPDGEPL